MPALGRKSIISSTTRSQTEKGGPLHIQRHRRGARRDRQDSRYGRRDAGGSGGRRGTPQTGNPAVVYAGNRKPRRVRVRGSATQAKPISRTVEMIAGLGKNQSSQCAHLILTWIILAFLSPYFFTVRNLFEITLQSSVSRSSPPAKLSYMSGGIDVSVDRYLRFPPSSAASVFGATGSVFLAVVTSLGAGVVAGVISGLFIARLNVPPFVATLGHDGRRARRLSHRGRRDSDLRTFAVLHVARPRPDRQFHPGADDQLVIFLLAYLVINYTRFGRFTYAIGSNRKSAHLSQASTCRPSRLASMRSRDKRRHGGVMKSARLGTVQPAGGDGYELSAIAQSS